ncbi:MAG TPA: hypothetical protein VJA21_12945 [Verrucomicrobiae bacterium]
MQAIQARHLKIGDDKVRLELGREGETIHTVFSQANNLHRHKLGQQAEQSIPGHGRIVDQDGSEHARLPATGAR